jgi:hypothetical protein
MGGNFAEMWTKYGVNIFVNRGLKMGVYLGQELVVNMVVNMSESIIVNMEST